MFSQTSPQIRLRYYISCWAGIVAFISAQHIELNLFFFKAIRNTKKTQSMTGLVLKFQDLPRVFSCFFWWSQVEDETTLNEVPCDLSRFHAQLRDHSPLERQWQWRIWGILGFFAPGEHDVRWWVSMDINGCQTSHFLAEVKFLAHSDGQKIKFCESSTGGYLAGKQGQAINNISPVKRGKWWLVWG